MPKGVIKPSIHSIGRGIESTGSADFLVNFKEQIDQGNFTVTDYIGRVIVREYQLFIGEVLVGGNRFSVTTTKLKDEPDESMMVVKVPASPHSTHRQATILGEGALALHRKLIQKGA